ncbi:MAG TPA: hypothetical protein VF171_08285 [Trueperaceae bacterium]
MPIPDNHRTRYELLFDRRRALRELERLAARLEERAGTDPTHLRGIVGEIERELGPRDPQASCAQLLHDVRTIYRGLVELSRLWIQPVDDTAPHGRA